MKRVLVIASFLICLFSISSCSSKKSIPSASRPLGKKDPSQGAVANNRPSYARSQSGTDYIQQYKAVAISEMNKYGIPASIKLAQALLESGNGNSRLAREANNHFGIKCGGTWNGKSMTMADDRPDDCFRVYNEPNQSFRDHSEFLLRPRYAALFKLKKDDYKGWAKGLKEAGYATNPRYPELLIELIERYELYQYDRGETKTEQIIREEKVIEEIKEKVIEEPLAVNADQLKSPVNMRIHEVKMQETLYSISKKYNVPVNTLRSLNGLTDDNLAIGQLLVISK